MQAMPLRNRRPPQPSAACHGSASTAGQTASPQPSSSSPRQTRGPRETPPKARKCMRPGHNEAHLEEQHVAQQELEDEEGRRALGVRTCATAQWCSGQEASPNRAATARGAEHGLGRHQHRVHARCAAIGMPITQRSNALEPKRQHALNPKS